MFIVVASLGQDISRNEADSLIKSLTVSKTDNDRIDILFKLVQFHLFKPGEYQVDLDSAKDCIEKAAVLNAKVKSAEANGFVILLKSLLLREKGQMKDGKAMAESAVAMLKNGKNKYYLGKAYFALSDYYDYGNADEISKKIRLVESAGDAFHECGSIERQAFTLTFLADLYNLHCEQRRALGKLDTALALYKSINHQQLQSIYVLYARIYFDENLFKQSLNYGLIALKCANNVGDTTMTLCQINNYVGITLTQLKEPEKAIGYFMKALEIAIKYNDNSSALQLMSNSVYTYRKMKEPEKALSFMNAMPKNLVAPKSGKGYFNVAYCYLSIYIQLKKYAAAQIYADQIVQLIKLYKPEDRDLNNYYDMLSEFYLASGQYASARTYISKLDTSTISLRRGVFWLKFRLDTAFGHHQSAVANLLAYQELNDSLFNENSNKQIKQLEVEYETEKNKNEISVLSQKNEVAQSRLDQAKLVKNFTIGGIVLMSIIIGLLYWQYRHKQQSNKVILQKNEQLEHLLTDKEWLVKEIHHRVKNNFHIVASLLEIQSSYLKNKEALSAIKESQHRIHSMSIIHQKLYQSDTLSTIHMPEYIYELVEYLRESYSIRENIGFLLQIENIELNHASAITLGLILNEAITNAIKYAFAKTKDGKISISLNHISDSQIVLSIADNGRGLPSDFNTKIGTSMGMELLQGLTDDLGGRFSIEANDGMHIKVLFDYELATASHVSLS